MGTGKTIYHNAAPLSEGFANHSTQKGFCASLTTSISLMSAGEPC